METTALLCHLGRRRHGMKMKRQRKYRQEKQQANEAAGFGNTGSEGKQGHETLDTEVCLYCQSGENQIR